MSDDGTSSLVVIALLGSPFSPAYARARASNARVNPLDFSAFNVCLQIGHRTSWALTERPAHRVARDRTSLSIGPTSMHWERDALVIDVRERTAPWHHALRGRIVFRPEVSPAAPIAIDGVGDHQWQPIAPLGRVEARFDRPGCSFQGAGYLDTNHGEAPLEESFSSWSWARVSDGKHVRITYDVATRDGRALEHGLVIDSRGARPFSGGAERSLRSTPFGLPRSVRAAPGESAAVVRTVENGPFYARSAIEIRRPSAAPLRGLHETLSLDRLASRWVRFLIPFRSRRET